MKIIPLILVLLATSFVSAQTKLPVIKAASKKALIVEGDDDRYTWYLNPEIKPDIHTISKILQPEWIKFYTDIDSIKVKIKPNENFDFIVLLNNKDTCYNRIESLPIKNYSNKQPATHDTIPFILTAFNNIQIKAILNKADTLDLMFDSGSTGILLTDDAVKNKAYSTKNGSTDNALQIGNTTWDSLPVYTVDRTGQGMDGVFGWDLFDGEIVEIDYDKNIFIVHSKLATPAKTYSRFKIEYIHTLFCIQAELQIANMKYPNRFLFDNGYQRTIMLDTALMKEQQFPQDLPVIKKTVMRNSEGQEFPIITVNIGRLNLGKQGLYNVPAQLLTTGNPAPFKTHFLGNEVLKRFNTLLDFQNNYVYLKPNSLFDVAYKDAK
jgi:hypothetical protein